MKNVNSLFYTRLMNEWKYQYHVWRLALDWTVMIYLIVPALCVAGYHYLQWWIAPPAWFVWIPSAGVLFVFFIHACRGVLRLFVEEADQLILRQRKLWMRGLRWRGICYSVGLFTLSTISITLLLLPIMHIQLKWNAIQIVAVFTFTLSCKVMFSQSKRWMELRYRGIFRVLVRAAGYVALYLFFMSISITLIDRSIVLLVISAALLLLSIRLLRLTMEHDSGFVMDVKREQKQKQRFLALVLGQAGVVEQKRWFNLEAPLIFRQSNRFYKQRTAVNILSELGVKTFFRKGSLVTIYLQFISLITAAITLSPPLWLKCTIWIAGVILLSVWLHSYWNDLKSSPLFKLYKWSFSTLLDAGRRVVFLLALPAFAAITVFSLFAHWLISKII